MNKLTENISRQEKLKSLSSDLQPYKEQVRLLHSYKQENEILRPRIETLAADFARLRPLQDEVEAEAYNLRLRVGELRSTTRSHAECQTELQICQQQKAAITHRFAYEQDRFVRIQRGPDAFTADMRSNAWVPGQIGASADLRFAIDTRDSC